MLRTTRRARRVLAGGMIAALGVVGALSAPAGVHAAGGRLYVGSTAGNNSGCKSPGFTSVQAAVDAAGNGATVYLCGANTYTGPVSINKSLTLTGDPGATLSPPSTLNGIPAADLPPQFAADGLFSPDAIVLAWGPGVDVNISGLSVAGPFNTGPEGCADNIFGVLILDGATASLNHDSVSNIRAVDSSLLGCQYGVAVQVGRRYWPTGSRSPLTFGGPIVENFVGSAQIDHTSITGYQKNGVTVDGPGSQATIQNSSVTGDGRVDYTAQNGIQISRGATGSVQNNTISGNAYTGPGDASSTGVLIFGGCGDPLDIGVDIHNNTLVNNDIGVYSFNGDDACANPPSTPTNVQIHNNDISNDAVSNISGNGDGRGYQAGITDFGNGDSIHNNNISGVGYYPAQDSPTVVVLPIDTSGSANANVHNNRVS